jgi:hypothetical protein
LIKPNCVGLPWSGYVVALANNGQALRSAAPRRRAPPPGIDGDQTNHDAPYAGAVWLY